jgi:DNA-directed RNA polymerase subunit A"
MVIDKTAVKALHTSVETVIKRLAEKSFKARLSDDVIIVKAEKLNFKELYRLKEKLKETHISGVEGIEQVLPVKRENEYVILTSGSNLNDIRKVKGVNPNKTTTNNIFEVAESLGIEAAREAIINETLKVIESQGLDIDKRHIKLVADAMTVSGEIKGITRIGDNQREIVYSCPCIF